MEEKKYEVYKHTAPDGRAYVGITRVGVENRWKNGYGYKKNPYFWRYILKNSFDSLTHEILASGLTEEEAVKMECELIAKWDLTNKEKGFNLDKGGSTNNRFWRGVYCIETGVEYEGTRIAERCTGINANNICYACNGKRSYAGKDSAGNKLHWVYSDEKDFIPYVIESIRFEKEVLNNKEKELFDKYKEKCIKRSIPKERKDLRRTVYQYNLQGELINTYLGLEDASISVNCNMSEIGQRCNGLGYTCGGYLWSYEPKEFSKDFLLQAQNASNHQTILQYDFDMNLIAEYVEGRELANHPLFTYKNIREVCNRIRDFAYGYVWRFKGETKEQYETDKEYYAKHRQTFVRNQSVIQYTLNGEIVKVFDSVAIAEKEGWGRSMVSLCCRGKKESYRGYIWKYAE